MRNRIPIFLSALCLSAGVSRAQQVDVREETLENGMKLLMVERHEAPTIAAGWVARVGSVNERPGITGISHLFEHMMFKGTETIGTRDPVRGADIRAEQDRVRIAMEKEYSKLREKLRRGEISGSIYDEANMTPRLKDLKLELKELFEQEKQVIVKDELDHIYTREGGSGLNAFTTNDQTIYLITIPANKLELWFWLESDRLLNPVFREFYSERDVVREERRLRTESTPTGELNELFDALFWQSSPYSWPVVGWPSDVESITRRQAEDYFSIHYAPNNITAVLVGDFKSDRALELARRYFGRIPRGKEDPPEVITDEIEQKGIKRFRAEADTNSQVTIRFHTVPAGHREMYALDVLASVLNGRTGRLYEALIEEKDVAVGQPFASSQSLKYGGFFQLGAQVKEGRTADEVEAALKEEIEKLKAVPVPDRELQKVKNQEMANSFRRLRGNFFLMIQLALADSMTHWSSINDYSDRLQAVTAEEAQAAAQKYFHEDNINTATYLRKEGVQSDPVLSSFSPEIQQIVRQQLQALEAADKAELEAALVALRQQLGQAPAQFKPALEYLIEKAEERLQKISEP